jgi:hypothetical protein
LDFELFLPGRGKRVEARQKRRSGGGTDERPSRQAMETQSVPPAMVIVSQAGAYWTSLIGSAPDRSRWFEKLASEAFTTQGPLVQRIF